MKQVLTRVTVDENGILKKDMSDALWRKLCRSFKGKRAELVLRSPKRSRRANGLYWAVIAPAIAQGFQDANGEHCSPEDAHYFMKLRYGESTDVICTATGEVLQSEKSTKNMTTDRYRAFIDEVLRFGTEVLSIDWSELDRDQVVAEFEIN